MNPVDALGCLALTGQQSQPIGDVDLRVDAIMRGDLGVDAKEITRTTQSGCNRLY